jgi:hypothetical protein
VRGFRAGHLSADHRSAVRPVALAYRRTRRALKAQGTDAYGANPAVFADDETAPGSTLPRRALSSTGAPGLSERGPALTGGAAAWRLLRSSS